MVDYKTLEEEIWVLTEEGQKILDEGSHEVKVFNFVPADEEGIPVTTIKVKNIIKSCNFSVYHLNRNLWVNPERLVKARPSRTSGSG